MKITTVQIPSYTLEGRVQEFLGKLAQLEPTVRDNVWKAVSDRDLHETVNVPMPDQITAQNVLQFFQGFSLPQQEVVDYSVFVASKTDPYTKYQVGIRSKRPVNCTCPDYVNRSKLNVNHVCKHMAEAAIYPSKYGINR